MVLFGIAVTLRYQTSAYLLQSKRDSLHEQEAVLNLNQGIDLAQQSSPSDAAQALERALPVWRSASAGETHVDRDYSSASSASRIAPSSGMGRAIVIRAFGIKGVRPLPEA